MFVTAKGQDLLTFSRSTTGTYIGSDGLLKTAAVDEARIEYDGSGNVQGLLLEPERTNWFLGSNDFRSTGESGYWVVNSGLNRTQDTSIVDPTGGNSAWKLTDTRTVGDGSSQMLITQSPANITPASGDRTVASVFARPISGGNNELIITNWGEGYVSFNLSNGTVAYAGGNEWGRIEALANGWYRCHAYFIETNSAGAGYYIGAGSGSFTSGSHNFTVNNEDLFHIYGAQVERGRNMSDGSFPTSYIPTAGTSVTRQEDVAYIDIDQFGVKQDRGTFVAEINNLEWFTNSPSAAYPRAIEFGNTTNNYDRLAFALVETNANQVYLSIYTDDASWGYTMWEDYDDSADVGPFSGKIAYRYDETSARSAKDGTILGNEDTDTNVEGQRPYRTRLALRAPAEGATGEGANVKLHLKSLKYYPRKVSDSELQTLTT